MPASDHAHIADSHALPQLTRLPVKQSIFLGDTFFQEGWHEFCGEFGSESVAAAFRLSLLIAKPEAVVTRSLEKLLDWLEDRNFGIVAMERFRFDRHLTRALWGHHWNAVTPEHKATVDLLVSASDSVAFVLIDKTPAAIPCSVRLCEGKGSASPELRKATHLRSVLGSCNQLLNYVHSPDEPADVVRELSVTFEKEKLRSILRRVSDGLTLQKSDLLETAQNTYARNAAATISLPEVCDALAGNIANASRREQLLESVMSGKANLRGIADECASSGSPLTTWQRVVLAAFTITSPRVGRQRLIPAAGFVEWEAAAR